MLIVLKEPIKAFDYDVLAVNLETFNVIVILNIENRFQLAILKYFDAHHSNQSNIHCILEAFDTYEQSLDFFQELVDALKAGENIFDLRSRKTPTDAKNKKTQGSGIL